MYLATNLNSNADAYQYSTYTVNTKARGHRFSMRISLINPICFRWQTIALDTFLISSPSTGTRAPPSPRVLLFIMNPTIILYGSSSRQRPTRVANEAIGNLLLVSVPRLQLRRRRDSHQLGRWCDAYARSAVRTGEEVNRRISRIMHNCSSQPVSVLYLASGPVVDQPGSQVALLAIVSATT